MAGERVTERSAILSSTGLASALADEHLGPNAGGEVVLKVKRPCRDGTAHMIMQPQESMQRRTSCSPWPHVPVRDSLRQVKAKGLPVRHEGDYEKRRAE